MVTVGVALAVSVVVFPVVAKLEALTVFFGLAEMLDVLGVLDRVGSAAGAAVVAVAVAVAVAGAGAEDAAVDAE